MLDRKIKDPLIIETTNNHLFAQLANMSQRKASIYYNDY